MSADVETVPGVILPSVVAFVGTVTSISGLLLLIGVMLRR